MRIHGKKVWETVKDLNVTVLAANIRSVHSIKPILAAAQEEESVVALELAKTESFDPCYTGIEIPELNELSKEFADEVGDPTYFLHEDHNTYGRKDDLDEDYDKAVEFRDLGIDNEYTSFSIDPSYLPLEENIEAAIDLSEPIVEKDLALEAEVGEVKGDEEITRVGEAMYYIESLNEAGISPNLLAIANGSVHGQYGEGQRPYIHLRRTYDIARSIQKYGVSGVAQHGTTGTPNIIIEQFPDHGIKKANVATNFQEIAFKHLPEGLKEDLEEYVEEKGKSSVKYGFHEFRDEMEDISEDRKDKIYEETYERARELIQLFNAQGLAKKFK